mgnify:FL=1
MNKAAGLTNTGSRGWLVTVLFSCWLMVQAVAAQGDTVSMLNGDQLSGKVDGISGTRIILETPYAGRVLVDVEQVQSLASDEAFVVRLSNATMVGNFDEVDGRQGLVTSEGFKTIQLVKVRSASQRRIAMPEFMSAWTSRVDLAVSSSDGNSIAQTFNTLIESDLKSQYAAHNMTAIIAREEGDETATKDLIDLDYGYKRFFSDRWFGSSNVEYFQDGLKEIDYRISMGVGMGYQFIDNSFGSLSSEVGISSVQEEVTGVRQHNPAARWALDFNRYLFAKRIEVFHRQSFLYISEEDRREVISSSTGLRYALNERIDTSFRVDMNYEANPAPGKFRLDTTYSLGLGVRF